jgi:hypothetical protein
LRNAGAHRHEADVDVAGQERGQHRRIAAIGNVRDIESGAGNLFDPILTVPLDFLGREGIHC